MADTRETPPAGHRAPTTGLGRILTVAADPALRFGLDYPPIQGPLHRNVSISSGWCFHPDEHVRGIHVDMNGRRQSAAILGYPRLDVAARFRARSPNALLSGFHCAFDAGQLVTGENRFLYTIELGRGTHRVEATATFDGISDRVRVSDVFIDIVGPCNIACAMCPQGEVEGVRGERGRGYMSVELFDRTLDYLQQHQALSGSVNLYNWGDPLLHPDLAGILAACRARGVKPILSTNLSFPPTCVREAVRNPVMLLIVSLSGFSSETYSRNHVRGDFQRVRENLGMLAEDRGQVETVLVKYLVFRYNRHEVESAKAFCRAAGFDFGAYTGAIPSTESYFRYASDPSYRAAVHDYIDPGWIQPTPSTFCPQESVITLNHRAELERCCVSWTSDGRLSVFDADPATYLRRKLKSDVCTRCMSSGYSYYKHFGIARPDLLAESFDADVPRSTGQSGQSAVCRPEGITSRDAADGRCL